MHIFIRFGYLCGTTTTVHKLAWSFDAMRDRDLMHF